MLSSSNHLRTPYSQIITEFVCKYKFSKFSSEHDKTKNKQVIKETFSHQTQAHVLQTSSVFNPNSFQPKFRHSWITLSRFLQQGPSLDELAGLLFDTSREDPQRRWRRAVSSLKPHSLNNIVVGVTTSQIAKETSIVQAIIATPLNQINTVSSRDRHHYWQLVPYLLRRTK